MILITMEQTVEIIMSNVKDHIRNTTGRDRQQFVYAPNISSRYLGQTAKGDLLVAFRNDVTTFAPISSYEAAEMWKQTEYKVAEILWQVCPVILFLFGTIGNVMILLMLRTLRLGRTSMHIYLRALAISDLLVLYTGLLRWWVHWTFGIDLRDQHVFLCKTHTWLVYVSIYVSAWLLVVMTLERTCSACLPHRVSSFCTKRRACFLIIFIVVFQSCMQSHFLVGMTLIKDEDNRTQCLAISEEYSFFIHDVWPLVDLCLLSVLPFIFVIVGNAVIVWKTFLSLKFAAELNLTSGKNAILRRRRASSMTVILLALSALFLLTTSPTCVYNIWEREGSALQAQETPQGAAQVELAWAVVNILMYCNNTFNFYLYCLSGRKFRNEMIRQFSRRRTDSQSNVLSQPSVQIHRFPMNNFSSFKTRLNGNGAPTYQSSVHARNSNAYL